MLEGCQHPAAGTLLAIQTAGTPRLFPTGSSQEVAKFA